MGDSRLIEPVEHVLPHGGDDLPGLLLVVLLQIHRHLVVQPHRVRGGIGPR